MLRLSISTSISSRGLIFLNYFLLVVRHFEHLLQLHGDNSSEPRNLKLTLVSMVPL